MGIANIVTEPVKGIFSKLNRFTLLQFLWIISLYFFVMNSLYSFLSKIDNESFDLSNIDWILEYNELILKFLKDNERIWEIFTVLLFISSIFVVVVAHTLFENYMFIKSCSRYGGDLSIWSLIIYMTYKLYSFTGQFFIIALLILTSLYYWIKENKSRIYRSFFPT
ncbi:hypothetical protein BJL90_02850 [Clostridium formicaceticum]|nr:hypothetical protein BJL90_02850 [Clostridium formicaceticum]